MEMAHGVAGHHGAHLCPLCAMQVVHLVEEGLADHPEVLDRLVVQLATLLRFAVARIDGAVERLLFLVERLHVVVVRIRVEVALVRETFGEEVIDDQEKFGVGRRVRLGVAASMVVGRAMAIVDEVEIDEEERTDVVHLGELERIVEVAICDQVRRDVSRLLLRRLEEMAIAAVRQTIALEDLVDRAKVHGAVGIVVEEIGVVEEIHRASRHLVMAIVDDPCLLVVGSGHRLVAVGFFAAFSRLPLLVEHPLCGALLLQPRFLFVDGLRLLPLFDESLPFGILRAILRVFQRFGLAFAAQV